VLLTVLPLVFVLLIITHSLRPVLIVSDPVWRGLVLEGEEGILPQLRIGLFNSFYRTEVTGIDALSGGVKGKALSEQTVKASLVQTLESHRASIVILSPAFSLYVDELAARFPGRSFVHFSGGGESGHLESAEHVEESIAVTVDLREAMQRAGERAAALADAGPGGRGGDGARSRDEARSGDGALDEDEAARESAGGGERPLVVILRLGADAAGERYASDFVEGLEGAGFSGRVQRLVIEEEKDEEGGLVEELRSSGVGSADFVWVWGRQGLTQVLESLEDWGVASCVVGTYAEEAYPGTVALSIAYEWKDALGKAVDRASQGSSSELPKAERGLRMEGVLRIHR
jgi:hypothetical protein